MFSAFAVTSSARKSLREIIIEIEKYLKIEPEDTIILLWQASLFMRLGDWTSLKGFFIPHDEVMKYCFYSYICSL